MSAPATQNLFDTQPIILLAQDEQVNAETSQAAIQRPKLQDEALFGLPGRIIKKLDPQTESHPAGNLMELLLSFGSLLGRTAYYQVEDTRHYTNEFAVKVGESSKARKGTGKNRIRAIMQAVDSDWLTQRNESGIGSGEVIVHLIRDPRAEVVIDKKTGNTKTQLVDAGVDDKRLHINIGEFQGILTVCHKPESLLSCIFRDGWDGLPLKNTVKNNPASCQDGHLSVMADTTTDDLSISLSQADRKNGFANRFLWVYVHRTKLLALGGEQIDWTNEVAALRRAVEFGKQQKRIFLDDTARKYWTRTLYPKLERDVPGLIGSLTSRASAHTLRLAMLYALLDLSDHIRLEHLQAGYALWRYCEDSVHTIFGDLLSPEQSQILDYLDTIPKATKSNFYRDCFRNNRKAALIADDLTILESSCKIRTVNEQGTDYYIRARR